ncbi:phage tail terminator family protein [Apilactobacillus xinyiensis]|uniref:phage tail terminator family protein n=1 Tax=Apilactobacillus xinyiensis TaxID=2841032 RepID=UPI003364CAA5
MIVDITGEIINKLYKIAPNSNFYRDNVKGGFKQPAFLINLVSMSLQKQFFKNQDRTYYYQVIYMPEDEDNPSTELLAMNNLIMDNFDVLDDFALIKDLDIKSRENLLYIDFNVPVRADYVDKDAKQGSLKYQGGLKEDGQ